MALDRNAAPLTYSLSLPLSLPLSQVFPMPTTCTLIHLVVGAVLMASLWILRIKKAPQINERLVNAVRALLPSLEC
jgi:uncharacterized membrane protein YdcZ (DUF606 family)